ncbi:hypothetical protein FRB91_006589 [Serendipita sp. 411]|nr:hypothetical protein FRB91_006589 [Serendipita sp. 411]
MAERKERLVLSILEFLEASIADGTVSAEDKDGIEVAVQCIGEAFGVDASDEATRKRLSIKPATLPSIFDVYMKTRQKVQTSQDSSTTSPAPQAAQRGSSAEDKAAAEAHKQAGNAKMSAKDYPAAIAEYTHAIALDPSNPVYYSNRAAAYSSSGDHNMAVADAEKAIEVDPKFVKAYHRLGHAHYCLKSYKEAASAFGKGLELEPNNANLKSGRDNALARVASNPSTPEPDPSGLSSRGAGGSGGGGGGGFADVLSSLGGGGAAGGGPGGFDLASLMQNPALMSMAQQMMANGGLENMMRNPAINNMMNRLQTGGGMPSMAELMSDPTMRQMAESFRNAQGGSGAGQGTGQ